MNKKPKMSPEEKAAKKEATARKKIILTKFLKRFPEDTDMWKDATDELMDIAREVREAYNDSINVVEGDDGYVEAIDWRSFTNPGKRNKAYRAQIIKLFPKLRTEQKDEIIQQIESIMV